MYKSSRYNYSKHPDYEKPSKEARKTLHRKFRSYEKICVRINEDIEPMKSRG